MNFDRTAGSRYAKHRSHARELLEDEAFHWLRRRVHVLAIDEDMLRRVRREWYEHPDRRVNWDWEKGIMRPLLGTGARYFHFALVVDGQLCALAAARLSSRRRWLSLTYLEGAPEEHPLKGKVLTMAVNALYIYRGVICTKEDPKSVGIRVLNPLDEAIPCYKAHGYSLSSDSKWLRSMIIEKPIVTDNDGVDDYVATEAQRRAAVSAATEDGARR